MLSLRERLLVRRLKNRDEKAFAELVSTYQNRIYNLVFRMLGDGAEAEDVAQEVFETVFKVIDSFRGDAQLSTWLYRIASNQCKNRIKYLGRRPKAGFADDGENGVPPSAVRGSSAPSPHAVLEGRQLEQAIATALTLLDDEQREVLVLRDLENLSYAEIGAITELPEGTIKSRLHRARMAVKSHLEAAGQVTASGGANHPLGDKE